MAGPRKTSCQSKWTPTPAQWWRSLCAEQNVHSARLKRPSSSVHCWAFSPLQSTGLHTHVHWRERHYRLCPRSLWASEWRALSGLRTVPKGLATGCGQAVPRHVQERAPLLSRASHPACAFCPLASEPRQAGAVTAEALTTRCTPGRATAGVHHLTLDSRCHVCHVASRAGSALLGGLSTVPAHSTGLVRPLPLGASRHSERSEQAMQ